jgi:virginiamycin B lyase
VASIGRITTTGSITDYPIPATAYSITAGPDGALWFTENQAHKIGRITTSGTVTEFASGGDPLDITAGPDGNLWFTEGDQIGRLTP